MGGLGTTAGAGATAAAGFGTSSSSVRSIRELSTVAGDGAGAVLTLLVGLDCTIEGVGRFIACMPVGVGFA